MIKNNIIHSKIDPALSPKIIFEDPHLIVLSKPAGLLSQGARKNEPNLVDWLRVRFNRTYIGLIHRLDRNTSGLIVVAKRSKSAARLTRALQEGQMKREYLGWVTGELKTSKEFTHYLLKDRNKNKVSVIEYNSTLIHQAKKAQIFIQPVEWKNYKGEKITLCQFILETGRSHQIRVQTAYEGFPLLGDQKYGCLIEFHRVALHSSKLTFPHPITQEILSFEESLPHDLKFHS